MMMMFPTSSPAVEEALKRILIELLKANVYRAETPGLGELKDEDVEDKI